MSMYENFETDKKCEREGVWTDYGQFRVRLSRAGGANKDFQKVLDRLTRPYRRAIATDTLDNEVANELLRRAYAKAVIQGWETKIDDEFVSGIESPDGEDLIDVSQESIVKVLADLPDLFIDLQGQATSLALYRASLQEDASGN